MNEKRESINQLEEITKRLEQGVTELFQSERYKEYLKVMSKFYDYSFNNTLLIAMQKPDATYVAGFASWKNKFGRQVRKGEKGIKIIAPSPFKMKKEVAKLDSDTMQPMKGKDGNFITEETEITIPAFKVISVFDISQTVGKELPSISAELLMGDVKQYNYYLKALEETSPVPIYFEHIQGEAKGYYDLQEKRIVVQEGMSELQTLKTTIHEIAHAKLHDIDLNPEITNLSVKQDRHTKEVEAESIAYVVCQHYGIDTSAYSFGYVAGWSSNKELSELKSSLKTINRASTEIIKTIDIHFEKLKQIELEKKEVQQVSFVKLATSIKTCKKEGIHTRSRPVQQLKKSIRNKNMAKKTGDLERG